MAAKAATKSEIMKSLAETTGLSKKQVATFFDELAKLMKKHLGKKAGAEAAFTLPGIAKFRVRTKPATPAKEGKNPFTGEPMMIKAKPARRVVRASPVKALKDAVM
jgi:nucleoid DNA-binding protein